MSSEADELFLMKFQKSAEEHLGHPVTDAVTTVPACFDDAQRPATEDADYIAASPGST